MITEFFCTTGIPVVWRDGSLQETTMARRVRLSGSFGTTLICAFTYHSYSLYYVKIIIIYKYLFDFLLIVLIRIASSTVVKVFCLDSDDESNVIHLRKSSPVPRPSLFSLLAHILPRIGYYSKPIKKTCILCVF